MAALFILAGGAAGVLLNVACHVLSKRLVGDGLERELHAPGGIWRPMTDVRMLYAPFAAPFVSAAALYMATRALGVSTATPERAVAAALTLWALGPGHGIVIDYCSTKMSASLAAYFLVSTAGREALLGYLLARMAPR